MNERKRKHVYGINIFDNMPLQLLNSSLDAEAYKGDGAELHWGPIEAGAFVKFMWR